MVLVLFRFQMVFENLYLNLRAPLQLHASQAFHTLAHPHSSCTPYRLVVKATCRRSFNSCMGLLCCFNCLDFNNMPPSQFKKRRQCSVECDPATHALATTPTLPDTTSGNVDAPSSLCDHVHAAEAKSFLLLRSQ